MKKSDREKERGRSGKGRGARKMSERFSEDKHPGGKLE